MLIKVAIPNQLQLKLVPDSSALFAGKKNEIHYIGGPEVLPAPLKAEEEAAFLSKLHTGSGGEARTALIEHNLRLVIYIAKKYQNTGTGSEDLISVGTIGLIKAVESYKSERNTKLATYASRCIENEIRMYLRGNGKIRREISLEEPLSSDADGRELLLSDLLGTDGDSVYRELETKTESLLLKKALQTLSARERTLIELRFGLRDPENREMTQKEAAERLGLSQSYLSRLEKKVLGKLRVEMMREE